MLPFEEKKRTPMTAGSDDVTSAAKRSAMSRLIEAIGSKDSEQALDALSDLMELMDD